MDIIGPVGFEMFARQEGFRTADLAVSGTNTDRQTGPIVAPSRPNAPPPAEPAQRLTLTMMAAQ